MTTHQRWTQSDITDLRARLQEGATVTQIADAQQRPPEAVSQMMSRLRLRAAQPA